MSRTRRHWTAPVSDTPIYTNNRRADWTYNADGAVISRDEGQRLHTVDAAGQQRIAQIDQWGGRRASSHLLQLSAKEYPNIRLVPESMFWN